ncbi:hypothetical protein CPB84DRAFT_1841675 [Gymnopilus junonius]|uniref:Uncharacterized protein n=1 Tax=Gymnopilus junonius TaxID=109634 RepID=A0A9P5NZC7_GYMJU|nr:hypothetical protein CPB84DRAFT_1841675 [Gymnopilus junonius]
MFKLFAAVVLGALPQYVAAQNTTKAVCQLGFNWAFNSLGQSPCDIASALGGVCVGTPLTLLPLKPGFEYLGPDPSDANSCRCSTVYYSLLSACATCQNADFITWNLYKTNCTVVYDEVFSNPLPPNVPIPHYAYGDVVTPGTFNVTFAETAGGAESTALPSPTGSSSGSTPSPTTTSQPTKKSHAGAIAGGVVGGVVGLALLAGLTFWFLRSRRPPAPALTYDPMMSQTPTAIPTNPMNSIPSTPAPKPYDPNDPTTFPTNTPGFNPYTPSPQLYPTHVTPNYTGASQSSYPRPQYTGAPEL